MKILSFNWVVVIIVLAIAAAVSAGVYYYAPAAVQKSPIVSPVGPNGSNQEPTGEIPAQEPATNTPAEVPSVTDKSDLIQVITPTPGAVIGSPLTVEGKARGSWYFEASFPVRLLDANGKELAAVPAQAQSDWMTDAFVPFKATLTFNTPLTDTGTLVFQKDNPSGLPQNENEIRVPVSFSKNPKTISLFYYNPANDHDGQGNIRCSSKGLVAVSRTIPVSATPIQDAIRLLLQGELKPGEKAAGTTTEFPLAGVELKGASLHGSELTLEFDDPQFKTSGGACRVSILRAQIEATAKQFPEVKSVKIIPDTVFQP